MVNHPIPSEVARRLQKPKAGHAAIGGSLFTPFTLVLGALIAIAMYFLAQRFIYGLGAVTNINNGYPWGIWVVWDVVIATGFACGGYAMALVVYILNKGEYHHLVRPALTASLFGYSLGGLSVLIDLGRYWNFWHILSPAYAQPGSVMFEVAVCISLYVVVLWIEFSPAFLEHLGMKDVKKTLNKFMFVFIGLGVLLPTMHQSSLGSLLVVYGYQIHPLWQTPLLPLLFLLTAVCMGFAIVILEATLAAVGFKRDIHEELPLLSKIGKIIMGILVAYLVIRIGDLIVRGAIFTVFTSGIKSVMFLIEMAAFAYPVAVLSSPANRKRLSKLLAAAMSMLTGAVLYRIDAFLVAYDTGPGWHYFPSAPEMMVTIGVIAIEVLAYIVFVRKFPVLPGHSTTAAAE
jgi:Ni/Fe-hydrogenase subunit HybB-like protein